MTLDEIAIKHGTDKATTHQHHAGHGYAPVYEQFFKPIKGDGIKLLEIGVGGGESIRTWLEYFTKAQVFGVDNNQGTNPWNTLHANPDPRYTFVYGDQSDEVFWKCFAVDYGTTWDVIIDDGGHFSNQVITTFRGMWPNVKPGGLYCIEDLGVCYGANSVFVTAGWQSHMEFLKAKCDEMNQGSSIESIHFSRELAIIRKR